MSYRDYLQLSSFPQKGAEISLDERMDLDAIRIYGLLKCLAVPSHAIDLGRMGDHLNTQWRIKDLHKTLIKLELYRYISIYYNSNKRTIDLYHSPVDVIELYKLNIRYMRFVQETDFEFTDQLYAHQCSITIVDYLSSLDVITVEIDSELQPDGLKITDCDLKPDGLKNTGYDLIPDGIKNTGHGLIPDGIKNTDYGLIPDGIKNTDYGLIPDGIKNTDYGLIPDGSKNTDNQNLYPDGYKNTDCDLKPHGLKVADYGLIPDGIKITKILANDFPSQSQTTHRDSQVSQDSAVHSSDSVGFTHPFLAKLESLTLGNSEGSSSISSNQLICNDNEKYLDLGIDKNYFEGKDTTDLSKSVSQSKNTNKPTDPLSSISSTEQNPSLPRIEDYHYSIDDLDWYSIALSLSNFIFQSFKDHKIIKSDAQRIINVIEHYHQTKQVVHSYQALLLKLFKAAKNNTLFDPKNVHSSDKKSAIGFNNARRAELISHTVTYQTLIEDYNNDIAHAYLLEHGLVWDGTRLSFMEESQ